jgi:hypothetical protein
LPSDESEEGGHCLIINYSIGINKSMSSHTSFQIISGFTLTRLYFPSQSQDDYFRFFADFINEVIIIVRIDDRFDFNEGLHSEVRKEENAAAGDNVVFINIFRLFNIIIFSGSSW